ncbi:t-SNARE, partial [Backusella circina FSU 941]
DDDRQYKELVQRIAQEIFHINGNITSIERLVGFLGTNKDSPDTRGNLHDVTNATRELIKESTNDLKLLANYQAIQPNENNQRRIEQQKLSKDFQKVVGHFQKIQKQSASKQREYVDKAKVTAVMLQSQADQEHEQQEQQQHYQDNIPDAQRQMQMAALDNEIEYNELLISERENEILNIEQGIGELNEIFRDMGMLVNEQESGIQSIYGNVLNIAQNTRQAADELVVASRHQRSARRYMCCFLLIISVVASVLAAIIAIAK